MRTAVTSDWLLALDPVLLAEAAGYTLAGWQQQVVHARPKRLLLNCCRQSGKSFCAAILAVHQALYEPGSLAVVAAPAQRQSELMIRTCRDLYTALGRPIPAEAENKLSLELSNGSRVVSIPSTEETVRGLSGVRLLIFDEAARQMDSFYEACLPFVAVSHGAIALLSSPAGRRGFFFRAFQRRVQDGWYYKEVHADQCSRIPAEFLAEMKRTTSEAFFQQEFFGAFNDATTGAFRESDIDRAFQHYQRWNLGRFEVAAASSADTQTAAAQQHDESKRSMGTWNLQKYLNGSTLARP